MARKPKPKTRQQRAVERLVAAAKRCAVARGEAKWLHGFRTGWASGLPERGPLYKKADRCDKAFRRLAQRIVRDLTTRREGRC